MGPEFVAAFGQFGPLGLMIAYLVWRERAGAERRDKVDQDRIEADKAMASALTALTVTIQALDQRLK